MKTIVEGHKHTHVRIHIHLHLHIHIHVQVHVRVSVRVRVRVRVFFSVLACCCCCRCVVVEDGEEGGDKPKQSQLIPSAVSVRIVETEQLHQGQRMFGGIDNVLLSTYSQTENGEDPRVSLVGL